MMRKISQECHLREILSVVRSPKSIVKILFRERKVCLTADWKSIVNKL